MMEPAKKEADDGIAGSIHIRDPLVRTGRFRALLIIAECMMVISNLVQESFNVKHLQESIMFVNAGRVLWQQWYEQEADYGQRSSLFPEQPNGDTGENSFATCLIWMDDNLRLTEWLAYHYHVLPLRYLVILIDQNSTTSPNSILDKWRNLMTIVQWNNTDEVLSPESKHIINQFDKASARYNSERYLHTQMDFYKKCTFHMKAHNRTWTAYIDTDEFIVLDSQYVKNVTQRMQKPGAVLELIKEVHALNKKRRITNGAKLHGHASQRIWCCRIPT
jgi:Glycosyl transferase family 2